MNFGEWGEAKAVRYLESLGYGIVERNFRCKGGEIDIIARDRDTLIFAEVKSRQSLFAGSPGMAVTPAKKRRLLLAAQVYRKTHRLQNTDCRVDLVEVLRTENRTAVRHTKGIF